MSFDMGEDDYQMFDQRRIPVVVNEPKTALDVPRFEFIREYVIAARIGGRAVDIGSNSDQHELVNTADGLYDKIVSKSMRVVDGSQKKDASR